MDKAAADKGLTVTTTDLIAQTDPLPGVGTAQELANALFAAKKNDPPAIAQTPQGFAVYQVTEIQAPQTPTFEQIKAKVEEQFKAQRAQALLAQKTQELSDRAHAEHDLKKAAKEAWRHGEDQRLGECNRAGSRRGRHERSGQRGLHSGRRARSAVRCRAVPAAASCWLCSRSRSRRPRKLKQNWDTAKDTLLEQKRQALEGLYVQNLRDKLEKEGKIKINKKEMERLSRMSEGS